MSDNTVSHNALSPRGSLDGVSEADGLPHVPVSRAELNGWYTEQVLSLQEIAEHTSARLGVPVTKTKVREWLLMLQIPRRSFSQAARARAQKRRASQTVAEVRPGQLLLFSDADETKNLMDLRVDGSK